VSKNAISSYNSGGRSQLSPEEKELMDSRKSPIKFSGFQSAQSGADTTNNSSGNPKSARSMMEGLLKGGNGEDGEGGGMGGIMGAMSSLAGAAGGGGGGKDDQNMQSEKRKFIEGEKKNKDKNFYIKNLLQHPVSAYEVKSGSIIPGVMITGITSDLPGNIVGQVRENVFDTVTGQYLLIPQGTRILGTYDSKVAYAQERVLIVWTRLIYPNGDSLDLEGMGGVDLSGYAGLTDQVNNHYLKLLGGVILSTMLSTSAKIAAGNNAAGQADISQLAVAGASEQINKVGEKIVEKNLNVQPTLEITPGFKFNVFVSKDLILKPYRQS
jgi:type IV secretion system protein VirB10